MNIEQLHNLLTRARAVIQDHAFVAEINQLAELLERSTANPSDVAVATDYQTLIQLIKAKASGRPANIFSPREAELMRSMGIGEAVGAELAQEINALISNRELLPPTLIQRLRSLASRLAAIAQRANKLDELVAELKLKETLGEFDVSGLYDAELSYFIPKGNTEHSLNGLKGEVRDLEMLVSSAGQLVGARDYQILYLSASDFGFGIATFKKVVDLIFGTLDWLAEKYKTIATWREILESGLLSKKLEADVQKELEEISADQFLQLARDATLKMLEESAIPRADGEVTKFARSISIAATKIQGGCRYDARILSYTADGDDRDPADSDDAVIITDETISNLMHRVAQIENKLRSLPRLPAPNKFLPSGDESEDK